MISVVIPLYNKEQSIASTLQTVLNQTYQDFEIVIVDDGSTDRSVEEVKKVADPRIRLIHQTNAGVSAARNRSIEEAKGEYIAFLDADDEWKSDYLKTQYELTQKYPECSVFACNYEFKDTQGRVTPTIIRKLPFKGEDGILSNYFEIASCSHPPLWTSAVIVKKSAIQSIGGFSIGIKSGEDLLTWARLAVQEKIAYSRKPLSFFCESESATDKSKAEMRYGSEGFVLQTLLDLYNKKENTLYKEHLKQYIIRWYKIYSIIQIETKHGHRAIRIAFKAICFGGKLATFLPIIILGILPNQISYTLFFKLR